VVLMLSATEMLALADHYEQRAVLAPACAATWLARARRLRAQAAIAAQRELAAAIVGRVWGADYVAGATGSCWS
jgi:hypothetical protein